MHTPKRVMAIFALCVFASYLAHSEEAPPVKKKWWLERKSDELADYFKRREAAKAAAAAAAEKEAKGDWLCVLIAKSDEKIIGSFNYVSTAPERQQFFYKIGEQGASLSYPGNAGEIYGEFRKATGGGTGQVYQDDGKYYFSFKQTIKEGDLEYGIVRLDGKCGAFAYLHRPESNQNGVWDSWVGHVLAMLYAAKNLTLEDPHFVTVRGKIETFIQPPPPPPVVAPYYPPPVATPKPKATPPAKKGKGKRSN